MTRVEAFTLLEMLLVVSILSAVTIAAISLVDEVDEQSRFDDTKVRLAKIRDAIAGVSGFQGAANPVISGFVADIGRLPNSVSELLSQGTLPGWVYNTGAGLWSGWRGPYLPSFSEVQGVKSFPDGWGNSGDTNNFGWVFVADHGARDVLVQSYGSDFAPGGTSGYAVDYPQTGFLVYPNDSFLDVENWRVVVGFHNPPSGGGDGDDGDDGEDGEDGGGPALPLANQTLRVRLFYPVEGDLNWPSSWPATPAERDNATYLSLAVTLEAGGVEDGATRELEFDFGGGAKPIPCGIRSVVVVDDATGSPYLTNRTEHVSILARTQLPDLHLVLDLE